MVEHSGGNRTTVPVVLSPSKVTAWSSCEHYLSNEILRQINEETSDGVGWLRRNSESNNMALPPTGFLDMLRRKGNFHELRCLEAYKRRYGDGVLEVPLPEESDTWDTWIDRIDDLEPFQKNKDSGELKYDVIFQMPFNHDGMRGIADFLIKKKLHDGDGNFIGYTYEPVDSKLARSNASKSHLLQLLFYAEAIEARKLPRPEEVHVALGKAIPDGEDPELTSFKTSKYWWHWKSKRNALKRITRLTEKELNDRTKAEKCSFCSMCDAFSLKCENEWGKDSLNDLAGALKVHREALSASGINRIAKLALIPKDLINPAMRDFDDEIKEELQQITSRLEDRCEETVDSLTKLWNARNRDDDLDNEQLEKLWRQACLQSIRKEHASCPYCQNETKISEDLDRCPNCDRSLFDEIKNENGKVIRHQSRHVQAIAPVFFFDKEEIERKMRDRYEKLSSNGKVAGFQKVQESILGLDAQTPYDVYLDFEGHPFWRVEDEIIFLFGYIYKKEDNWEYESIWSHDKNDMPSKEKEKEAAIELLNRLHAMWKENPSMKIYHYNHTERTLLKDLTGDSTHPSNAISVISERIKGASFAQTAMLDELIDEGVFVDLLSVVRNSLQVGYQSMSLKYMEKLAGFKRKQYSEGDLEGLGDAISAGAGAVFHYELFANYELYDQEQDPEIIQIEREKRKQLIADYNEDDVQATRYLHEWLILQRQNHPLLPTEGYEINVPKPPASNAPNQSLINRINTYLSEVQDG
ncbi:MAG: ribonuclease H-like domain-containing protein [Actinomycetota bacterium]